ncbi:MULTISPECIES: hypothetical protein [Bradyrhizobium]|uniref:Uncharacterized protein n=1 Tax=Bradyrhizobium septentrionale TaxID=1404411 RepID=A0A973W9Y8_9BRAD|nr:hypothetical protein [Bradyrhizobium septentrionale]UGY18742.1 hypothetical protein HAP48_0015570 [Bradyrhizobium septentrionale]UGY27473.1 hypothetical protein HU675_0012320 [Bradyrhizobium septentrionale]
MTNRGKGPLAGWRGSLEETTDTFDIETFLKTDGPKSAQEFADLTRAIAEGGTFGDYRRVETEDSERENFFVYGPNSILFLKKVDRSRLVQAIEALRFVRDAAAQQYNSRQAVE